VREERGNFQEAFRLSTALIKHQGQITLLIINIYSQTFSSLALSLLHVTPSQPKIVPHKVLNNSFTSAVTSSDLTSFSLLSSADGGKLIIFWISNVQDNKQHLADLEFGGVERVVACERF
jgi:hypothetical protein